MRLSTAIALCVVSIFAPAVFAATAVDIDRVVELVDDPTTSGHEKYQQVTRVVFDVQGFCYTLYHTQRSHDEPYVLLSVYLRVGKGDVRYFSDRNLDGVVDFGHSQTTSKLNMREFDIDKKIGEEYRTYYQTLYDLAIRDAIRHLESKE